ncbi:MAG: CPBP family glutamic-type intramembrane protease, partial [Opitutales bacterium]|nr:CPBP family glutamic-type intramembrane protease [Opitutales bacterium]
GLVAASLTLLGTGTTVEWEITGGVYELLGNETLARAMHANLASFAPLVALGLVFALAYERTGRISTTIVAHALFNLTATLLVLAGVDL